MTDSICDGPDDKTIDGIWVNDQSNEIHVFQAKLVKGDKTLGDVSLKELNGSSPNLLIGSASKMSAATTKNKNWPHPLREKELDIAGKIEKG